MPECLDLAEIIPQRFGERSGLGGPPEGTPEYFTELKTSLSPVKILIRWLEADSTPL
jgi:hypothetical protein